MRFGFWIGNGHRWDEILRSGMRAEETGWDGLWFADHFMPGLGDDDGPIHEAWTALSALAQATDRVRLGPLVCGNTYRNPAVLLKQAVTADHISNGRMVLGLGAGWQENEHRAYGVEYGSFTDRFEKLEESLRVIAVLRSGERATFSGDHYRLDDAPFAPQPIGRLPILLGGGGEKETLRMVAEYADEWNVWSTPEVMVQKSAVLGEHCARLGRDPADIERSSVALLFLVDTDAEADKLRAHDFGRPSLIGTPGQLQEQLAAYAEAGVDELIIPDFTLGGGAEQDETLDRFLAEVAAPFRS